MEDYYGYNCACNQCRDNRDDNCDDRGDSGDCCKEGISGVDINIVGLRFLHRVLPNHIASILGKPDGNIHHIAGGDIDDPQCILYIKEHFDLHLIYGLQSQIIKLDNMKCMAAYTGYPPSELTDDQLRRYHYHQQ